MDIQVQVDSTKKYTDLQGGTLVKNFKKIDLKA